MSEPITGVGDVGPPSDLAKLAEGLEKAIERLGEELKRIDAKIDPVIEEAEKEHSESPLLRANLELKNQYIKQKKVVSVITAFRSYWEILVSLVEESAALAEAAAKEEEKKAEISKAEADAEAKAANAEADAEKADEDARATADAELKKAEAENEKAQRQADAARQAADRKAQADLEAARKKAAADRRAADKRAAAEKQKAIRDARKAIAEALGKAAASFEGSAEVLNEIRAMKEEIEKELAPPVTETPGGGGGPQRPTTGDDPP